MYYDNYNIATIVNAAVISMNHIQKTVGKEFNPYIGHASYLKEFRTISLGLPRRSGKTFFLEDYNYKNSSLLLSRFVHGKADITHLPNVRGVNARGMKYRAILLDEYKGVPDEVYKYAVTDLKHANLLEDGFFILNLYTP